MSLQNTFYYNIMELRLYQTPNLLKELAVQITAPDPTSAQWSATNLITNLQTRTSGKNLKPMVDKAGTLASFESCYKTSNT